MAKLGDCFAIGFPTASIGLASSLPAIIADNHCNNNNNSSVTKKNKKKRKEKKDKQKQKQSQNEKNMMTTLVMKTDHRDQIFRKPVHDRLALPLATFDDKICGVIFMSNMRTRRECLRRRIFGLPWHKKHIVDHIVPGMKLFLFEYEHRQLWGVFEATSFGDFDIEPNAFTGGSFPCQVRVKLPEHCIALEEYEFCEAIKENYYDTNKFHFQLSEEQVLRLCYLFAGKLLVDGDSTIRNVYEYDKLQVQEHRLGVPLRESNLSSLYDDLLVDVSLLKHHISPVESIKDKMSVISTDFPVEYIDRNPNTFVNDSVNIPNLIDPLGEATFYHVYNQSNNTDAGAVYETQNVKLIDQHEQPSSTKRPNRVSVWSRLSIGSEVPKSQDEGATTVSCTSKKRKSSVIDSENGKVDKTGFLPKIADISKKKQISASSDIETGIREINTKKHSASSESEAEIKAIRNRKPFVSSESDARINATDNNVTANEDHDEYPVGDVIPISFKRRRENVINSALPNNPSSKQRRKLLRPSFEVPNNISPEHMEVQSGSGSTDHSGKKLDGCSRSERHVSKDAHENPLKSNGLKFEGPDSCQNEPILNVTSLPYNKKAHPEKLDKCEVSEIFETSKLKQFTPENSGNGSITSGKRTTTSSDCEYSKINTMSVAGSVSSVDLDNQTQLLSSVTTDEEMLCTQLVLGPPRLHSDRGKHLSDLRRNQNQPPVGLPIEDSVSTQLVLGQPLGKINVDTVNEDIGAMSFPCSFQRSRSLNSSDPPVEDRACSGNKLCHISDSQFFPLDNSYSAGSSSRGFRKGFLFDEKKSDVSHTTDGPCSTLAVMEASSDKESIRLAPRSDSTASERVWFPDLNQHDFGCSVAGTATQQNISSPYCSLKGATNETGLSGAVSLISQATKEAGLGSAVFLTSQPAKEVGLSSATNEAGLNGAVSLASQPKLSSPNNNLVSQIDLKSYLQNGIQVSSIRLHLGEAPCLVLQLGNTLVSRVHENHS